ncbi:hypothetical protein ACSOQY_003286, partial [Yersinia enterocolitica]
APSLARTLYSSPVLTLQNRVVEVCQQSESAIRRSEVNDKAVDNLVSDGFTAPRGTPVAYATTTPTARFPFI